MKKKSFFDFLSSAFYAIDKHERRITTATFFTIIRILLTPIIVVTMVMGSWRWACGLFVCAALTDLIDGWYARYFDQKTFLGACLDPIADKFLMISCFFTFFYIDNPFFYIPQWFVIAVLIKELIQIIGVCWLWLYYECRFIEPVFLGKITMAFQILFIGMLFVGYFFSYPFVQMYNSVISMLFILMCASFVNYVLIGIRIVKSGEKVNE